MLGAGAEAVVAPVRPTPVLARRARAVVRGAAAWLGLTAALTLLAWAVGRPEITGVLPNQPPVSPVAGVAFALLAVALVLLPEQGPGGPRRRYGQLAAAAAAALGAVALGGYAFDHGTPLDRFLVPDPIVEGTSSSGRLSPFTAVAVLAGGLAVLVLDARPDRGYGPAAVLVPVPALAGLTAVLAYVFDRGYLHGLVTEFGLALPLPSMVALLVLTAGLYAARPDRPMFRALVSSGPGGVLARRLTPVLLLLPVGIGLLDRTTPHLSDNTDLTVTLATLVSVGGVAVLVGVTVRGLDRADQAQRRLLDRLREQRDFDRALMGSLHDGVVVVDTDSRVVAVNDGWCEMTGLPREAMLGTVPPYPWTPPEERQARTHLIRGLVAQGAQHELELTVRRSDGSVRTVLASSTPVRLGTGGFRHYLGSFKDITDRKAAEDTLAAHAAELERANAALADASQLKSDLIAMLSHELRQPLFVITNHVDLLLNRWERLADEQRRGQLVLVDAAGRQLSVLFTDLLTMFRLEAQQFRTTRTPVSLATAAGRAVDALGPDPGVEVDLDPDLVVLADQAQLRQMLVNLLTNAEKYGARPIRLVARPDGDTVQIEVHDQGPGVPPEFVPHLFDRFTRAGDTGGVLGTGLGLFILRRLAEANGGTVDYRPGPAGGSVFVVRLELAPLPAATG